MAITLPKQIERIETEIAELEESLAIEKNPPAVKIDETAYAALADIRKTLAEAKSKQERTELIKAIESGIANHKEEVTQLRTALTAKQERINELKAQQQQAYAVYRELEAELLQQAKALIGLAQTIASESVEVSGNQDAVVFEVRTTDLNRLMDLKVDELGRVLVSVKDSGLLSFRSDGFGSHPYIPDFQTELEPA